jgi:hypothetical protein
MAKAKKVVESASVQQPADVQMQILNMLQNMDRRLNMLEQSKGSIDPGNPMFSQPSNRLEKRTVAEVKTAKVHLECFTDTRKPYIAKMFLSAGKVERDFFEGQPIRTTSFHGPIIETKLDGMLPLGTVLECRDGYGLSWYAVSEKGAIELESYEKAVQLLQ